MGCAYCSAISDAPMTKNRPFTIGEMCSQCTIGGVASKPESYASVGVMNSLRDTTILGDRAAIFAKAIIVLALWSATTEGLARPRPPLPPFPEFAGPVLFCEKFDWAYSVGLTSDAVVIANYGTLRESWTGMALQRSGPVTPFIVPALAPTGHTNVASHTESAVRFWLTPYWGSPAAGGTGPGKEATLVELFATDGQEAATLWSLRTTPDGSGLVLIARGDAGPIELLRADIAWTSSAHCLALNFGPEGTAIFVDGALAAKGPGTVAVPPNFAGLVFGSTWTGSASAEGDLDEIHVFGRPLSELAMAWHYATHAGQAALGPVSEAEWQAQRDRAAKRRAERAAALASAEGGGMMTTMDEPLPLPGDGGGGGGGTDSTCNSLTNFTVGYFYSTNGLSLGIAETTNPWIVLTIQTATTNASYDVFGTTNMVELALPSLGRTNWAWLVRANGQVTNFSWGQTNWCERYFQLGTMQDSDNDGLTDAYEQLVRKTSPTNANCPRVLYETVISNQSPSGWFKLNDSSFTNLAASGGLGLTNQGGGWSPDVFAYGNSAYSFTNNTDRLVVTNDAIGGGTGDATNQGSFTLLFKALTRQATSKRYVLSQGTATSNAIAVYFDGTGANGALKVGVGTNEPIILQDSNLVRGAWYYLAVTCDEMRTNSNEVRWYLGRVGSQALQAGSFALGSAKKFGNNGFITLGNKENGSSAFRESTSTNGSIDQVAFWKRELTEAEVNAQFNTLYPLFQGPAKVFDLTRWNLLLPVDKLNQLNTNNLALEIDTGWLNSGFKYLNPTNWTQQYFYLSNGNQMVFEAPWNGARSSTNGGPRSELRETETDGAEYNWKPYDPATGTATNTHILQASCAVDAATNSKVIIGQIHAETPNSPSPIPKDGVPAITLYFDSRDNPPAIKLAVYWNPSNTNGPNGKTENTYTLVSGVSVNDRIDYQLKLDATSAGAVTNYATVAVNGGTPVIQPVPMTAGGFSGWGATNVTLYFKAGCYYPVAPAASTAKVTFSSLTATHQP